MTLMPLDVPGQNRTGTQTLSLKTKTNELTVEADSFSLLTKSLRPLPEKHAGLVDKEQRYRKRYLDLLTNKESLEVFKTRSKLISEIRNIFIDELSDSCSGNVMLRNSLTTFRRSHVFASGFWGNHTIF